MHQSPQRQAHARREKYIPVVDAEDGDAAPRSLRSDPVRTRRSQWLDDAPQAGARPHGGKPRAHGRDARG
jgi:hypothetical protein